MSPQDCSKKLKQVSEALLKSLTAESLADIQGICKEEEFIYAFLEAASDEKVTDDLMDGSIGKKIIHLVASNRLGNVQWRCSRPSRRWTIALLRLTRNLVKNKLVADAFHELSSHAQLVKFVDVAVKAYFDHISSQEIAQIVSLTLNVLQKLCGTKRSAELFVEGRLHKSVLPLLSCKEMAILQATLEILGRLNDWSPSCRSDLCASTAVDVCLQLSANSDLLTQKLCVSLLRILSCESYAREQIKIYDGIPLLVNLLSVRNSRLQWHVAWTLAQLADDSECALEIGQRGAIAVVLAESASSEDISRGALTDALTMLTGLCALLAQLCQVDSNVQLIVRNNGLYILGRLLLLPLRMPTITSNAQLVPLMCSIFRVLRLLFSLERNRHFFRKVFEPNFFSHFIDIGHFVQDLSVYRPLADEYLAIIKEASSPDVLSAAWETANQQRTALGEVGEYELLEQLGAGAFGCVYTVRKKAAPLQYYALKEIYMMETKEFSVDKSFGDVISEVRIIKQQLRHPNIVRYRRIFVENGRLYIVMDLIDGTSLREHIHSTAEKKMRFSEQRVSNILVQLVLALRYLHKDKRIVHRDLKPNNIMLAEGDRVVITDFGLAKQRGAEYLKSAAGTIVYSCPEIVQNLPYGDKADVWSLGCCLYELCNLVPAFHSQNMLKLTMLIVEGKFEPINDFYSHRLRELISACLKPDPDSRPDITQVGEMIVDRIMIALDEQIRTNIKRSREIASEGTTPAPMTTSLTTTASSSNPGALSVRSDSLSSSFSSEQLSNSLKEVSISEKRFKLPPVMNSIDKIGKPVKHGGMKSLSAGARGALPLSCSLPRIASGNILPPIGSLSSSAGSSALKGTQGALGLAPNRRASSSSAAERGTSLLALRSAALRPVSDPVVQMLAVLQKLLFVCDQSQPLADYINHKRRVLDHFRKRVFRLESTPDSIKLHMRKLASESPEEVRLELGYADFRAVLSDIPLATDSIEERVSYITYEQLAAILNLEYSQMLARSRS